MNLLIAIICDTYDRVNMTAQKNDQWQLTGICLRLETSLAWRRSHHLPPTYLVFAEYATHDEEDEEWTGHVKAITEPVLQRLEIIDRKHENAVF